MKTQINQFSIDMGIDNLEDIASLYKDYLEESYDLIEGIQSMINQSAVIQPELLEKIVHNLKGVSANLYVEAVFKKATILDDFLKSHNHAFTITNDFTLLWENLHNTYDTARYQIIQFFSENGYDIT
jgi:HPt (histidine-containing phosphotransfer) domain-containing protein